MSIHALWKRLSGRVEPPELPAVPEESAPAEPAPAEPAAERAAGTCAAAESEKELARIIWRLLHQGACRVPPEQGAYLAYTAHLWHPCPDCSSHYQTLIGDPAINWELVRRSRGTVAAFTYAIHNAVNIRRGVKPYPWGSFAADIAGSGAGLTEDAEEVLAHTAALGWGAGDPCTPEACARSCARASPKKRPPEPPFERAMESGWPRLLTGGAADAEEGQASRFSPVTF